jgi:hypothetical protein
MDVPSQQSKQRHAHIVEIQHNYSDIALGSLCARMSYRWVAKTTEICSHSIALFKTRNAFTEFFNVTRNIRAKDGWERLYENVLSSLQG